MLHSLMLSPLSKQSKHCPGHELDSCMLTTDAALLLSTLRRFAMVLTHSLLSILLLHHLESFLFAGIDVAFPDA